MAFLIPDQIPQKSDAICCPSYGLYWNKTRLTEQGRSCVIRLARLYNQGRAPLAIFSNAYEEYWRVEAKIKNRLAVDLGIPERAIVHLEAMNNTYDEASYTRTVMRQRSAKSLILVADRWHMKRALDAFRRTIPEAKIYPASVRPDYYEVAREPSLIKSIRSGFKVLWILWNIIFFYLNPLLIKITKNH